METESKIEVSETGRGEEEIAWWIDILVGRWKALGVDSGDGFTMLWTHSTSLNSTLRNGKNDKYYVCLTTKKYYKITPNTADFF